MSTLRETVGELSDDGFFDLLESEEAYLLVVDVPGVTAETLEVTVEDGRIDIEADREKPADADYRYVEENRPLFLDLDLPVPDDVSEADAEAVVERGVLEVTLPKRASPGETAIDVVSGEDG